MKRVRFKDNELVQGRGYGERYKRDMRMKKRREQVLKTELMGHPQEESVRLGNS